MSAHKTLPEKVKRKPDCTKNNADKLEELIQRQREKEKHMYPVRINKQTVVYRMKKKDGDSATTSR